MIKSIRKVGTTKDAIWLNKENEYKIVKIARTVERLESETIQGQQLNEIIQKAPRSTQSKNFL